MKTEDIHISDQQLLLCIDGESSGREEKLVRRHLDACWTCRARYRELETAITEFVRVHQRELEAGLPPADGPRALLKARLSQLTVRGPDRYLPGFPISSRLAMAAAIFGMLALGLLISRSNIYRQMRHRTPATVISIPDSRLTPGATLLVSRTATCKQANVKNKAVPMSVQRKVLEEYGLAGADPRAYEIDYLVTPALGGADDIHNLWPHSYSATVWNALVKDELEDRLRQMVCDGSLNLTDAQQEIAGNWIAAYKKYFRTDVPLAQHSR